MFPCAIIVSIVLTNEKWLVCQKNQDNVIMEKLAEGPCEQMKINHEKLENNGETCINISQTNQIDYQFKNTKNDETILENVKMLLCEVLNLVENSNENHEEPNCKYNGNLEENLQEIKQKGILKHEKTASNKHVDFDLTLEYIPFDPKNDYTIDIQFVEKIAKRVVSYAALFAQKKDGKLESERKTAEAQKEHGG